MQAIILLLNAIFAKLTTAVNKAFEKSQRGSFVFTILQSNVTGVFNTSVKNADNKTMLDVIIAANKGAGQYIFNITLLSPYFPVFTNGVGSGSVVIVDFNGTDTVSIVSFTGSTEERVLSLALDEAVMTINPAIAAAAQTAKTDAITAATGSAKIYTDAEIAKLQQYASIGIKSYKTFEGLVTAGPTANSETIANLPSYVAFGIPTTETGAHIINVTGVNADGTIVDDKEFTMIVPTGVDAQGAATTTTIQVSTNDKLIVELYKLADGSFFMKYVQKYDDRLMEVVKQLIVKIDTQVSETELQTALDGIKVYIDATVNAALV